MKYEVHCHQYHSKAIKNIASGTYEKKQSIKWNFKMYLIPDSVVSGILQNIARDGDRLPNRDALL